jgi:glycyl-tRNA synthetase beta chain
MNDLLVEIGTEELPPKSLSELVEAFAQGIEKGLQKAKLSFAKIEEYATPRRLAVLVTDLVSKQQDQIIERRGPAWQNAFDNKGKPTKATLGFAKSCGAEIKDLKKLETEKGAWVFYKQRQPGVAAVKLIPEIVTQALKTLPIPRMMRWGAGDVEFVRPVHWVVMMYGKKVINANIFGIKTGQETHGHRFHYPHNMLITKPKDYESLLEKKGFVIADFVKRKNIIYKQIKKTRATAIINDELLSEVAGLVEWPVALLGNFKKDFLRLPKEVLISALQKHQKYFPVNNKQNKLLPQFIAISNIKSKKPKQVIEGNERVINARLTDAEFFYHADVKKPLENNLEKLKGLVFQDKLGSMYDKTLRVTKLAEYIAKQINADMKQTKHAAKLSKADLITEMVGEFPDLQGIMGSYYSGIIALKEQYLPRFSGDTLPATKIGQALSIADRIDTLVGIFAINQAPTGDKDPFGLRRAALGILRIIIEKKLNLDLLVLINKALQNYGFEKDSKGLLQSDHLSHPRENGDPKKHYKSMDSRLRGNDDQRENSDCNSPSKSILDFLFERLRFWYLEKGVSSHVFAAVLARFPTSPLDFDRRVQAVIEYQKLKAAKSLAIANKRVSNILKKTRVVSNKIKVDLLIEKEEQELVKQIAEQEKIIQPFYNEKNYSKILKTLAKLKKPVDDFFDKVMVMTEDEKLKNNRLALLNKLRNLFLHVADISLLQE